MIQRGFSGGWSGAWRGSLWARVGDGDQALKALEHSVSGFAPNLFNSGRVFQIDANFGVTAAIAEMLMQSHLRGEKGRFVIALLPALPTDWSSGAVSGLRARGGFEVSFSWAEGQVVSYDLSHVNGGECVLRFGGLEKEVRVKAGETVSWVLDSKTDTKGPH